MKLPSLCFVFGSIILVGLQRKTKNQTERVKPEDIQGCYELALSKWEPKTDEGEAAECITPPSRIQLLAEKGKEGSESKGYVVRSTPGVSWNDGRPFFWLPKGSHSIEIHWTPGYCGVVMDLTVDGDTLKGKAGTFSDYPRERQTADVIGKKVNCVAAPTGSHD
jgi:hypothetical protein